MNFDWKEVSVEVFMLKIVVILDLKLLNVFGDNLN